MVVNNIASIRSLSNILARQTLEVVQKYAIARFIISQALHLPKRMRDISKDTETIGTKSEESREVLCAKYVNKHMGFAVSKLYIDKHFDRLARREVIIIYNNVIMTYFQYILGHRNI